MSDIPPRRLFPGETQPNQLDLPPMVGTVEFIQMDIVCSQCGYNLRGQARDGRCPECGTGVMEAFRRRMLIYADRAWLVRVRSGVLLVLWGIVGSILFTCILMGVGIWFGASQQGQPSPQFQSAIQIPSAVFGVLYAAFGVLVLHRLTTPEPQPGETSTPIRRGRIRVIMTLAWIALAFQLINAPIYVFWGPQDPMAPDTAWIIYSVVLGIIGNVGYLVGFVLLMLHLRTIARRDRTLGLGKLFSFLMWSSAAVFIVASASGIAMLLMSLNMSQGSFLATTMTTTNVGGHTVTFTGPASGPTSAHSTQPATTSAPFAAHPFPPSTFFLLMPVILSIGCFSLVIFILGIVAAVKFYRALSWGIDFNVGMAAALNPSAPSSADDNPFGSMGR